MIADDPAMADIGAVCIIATGAPEADGTHAGNETTLAPVTGRAGSEPVIGWTYAAVAAGAADLLSRAVAGRSAVDVPDTAPDPPGR